MEKIILTKPDDWHLHIREGVMMKSTVGMSALQMARAVIMPNLSPPIINVKQAKKYHTEITKALNITLQLCHKQTNGIDKCRRNFSYWNCVHVILLFAQL